MSFDATEIALSEAMMPTSAASAITWAALFGWLDF
jgi:hypothetical protein